MKQNCYLYKTPHISYSKKKSSLVWQHNSCLLVNTENYFISSTLGHFATSDMCWHFFSIVDYNFPSMLLFLTPPILVAPTCTQTRNYDWDIGTQNLGPQCMFPSSLVVPGPPQEEFQENGQGGVQELGHRQAPPGSPPGIAALMGGTGVSSLFRADPSPTTLMESVCPGHCWLSPACSKPHTYLFRGLTFGTLLWKDYWEVSTLQPSVATQLSFCLASSVALKREELLKSKLVPPVSFPLDLELACSEINQYNI